jgi:hypothetical protein
LASSGPAVLGVSGDVLRKPASSRSFTGAAATKVLECGRDTKSVAGCELFSPDDIGVADRSLEYDPISGRDREDIARLLGGVHLKLNPRRNQVDI